MFVLKVNFDIKPNYFFRLSSDLFYTFRDNEYDIDDLLDDIKVEPIPKVCILDLCSNNTF